MQNLILLPGLLCDKTAWAYQIQQLSTITTIIVPNLSRPDTPEKMVKAVMDVAPSSFALAGHSMGGWIALEIMRTYKERVTRLCLINTTAKPDSAAKIAFRKDMITLAEKGDFASIINQLAPLFVYKREYLKSLKAMFEHNKHAFIHQETAMLQQHGTRDVLSSIHCPTLVIHAENDQVFHIEDSQELANNIRDAKLAVIPACGHMSIMESAPEICELMHEWLIH